MSNFNNVDDTTDITGITELSKPSNSIYLLPISPQEVYNLILNLNGKKAKRESDIKTRFIQFANPVISVYLSSLFNH